MGGNLLGIGVATRKRGPQPVAIEQNQGGGQGFEWGGDVLLGDGRGHWAEVGDVEGQMQVGSEHGQVRRWNIVEIIQPDAVSGHQRLDFLGKRAERHAVKDGFVAVLIGQIADGGGWEWHMRYLVQSEYMYILLVLCKNVNIYF